MRRRLMFVLPDVPAARSVLNELLLARIEASHIHFLAQRDSLPPDLPEAGFLQKTDFLHALRTGGMVGAAAGATGGALVWIYPPHMLAPELGIVLITGLLGAVLGAWFSSMAGSSVPNSALRAFQEAIDAGRVLLMIDVPFGRTEEIRDLVTSRHPEAAWGGIAPHIPAFP